MYRFQCIGPSLKSYWPNTINDISKVSNSLKSTEICLRNSEFLTQNITTEYKKLPVRLHQVARENMSEWRRNRSKNMNK